jgi:biopolymer transport protein ExbB
MKTDIIKRCIITILGLMIFAVPGFSAQDSNQSFDKVSSEIDQEASRASKDAAFTANLVKKDKKELTAILAKIKKNIKKEKKALDALKVEFKTLSKRELALTKELETEHQEVQDVEGSVRGTLKDAVSMVRDNPITAQDTQRSTMVNAMMDSKKFPGMKGIQSLVDLYFDELDKGSKIVSYNGEYIGVDGKVSQGQIIRAGRFTAYVKKADGTIGFLKPEPDGERLIAVAGEIPNSTQKAMDSYFTKTGDVLPIDPSGGAVFAQLTEETDWRDFMERGGILMWPILALAVVALLLIIERLIVLGTTKANTDKIMEKMNEAAQNSQWDECQLICEENKGVPTCSMLGSAMNHIGATQEILENALQEGILRQLPRLERFLPTMGVLAAIAPLMGLLGTVTGMINIFRVITVVGTGDPRVMSGGISEALLTTQFGLAVAIPLMIIHHMLERRVDRIVGDMEEKGTAFAVTLMKQGAITENEAQSV